MPKFGKFCVPTTESYHPYQRFNPKLKIGKQMNTLADYAKRVPSDLVLFDWTLLRQIKVSYTSFVYFIFLIITSI